MITKTSWRDNGGSALVSVLICMLFIGIIASVVISIARSNLDSSQTYQKSSQNFYDGEESLDVLKSKLQNLIDQASAKAYNQWLENYAWNQYHLSSESGASAISGDELSEEQTTLFKRLLAKEFADLVNQYFNEQIWNDDTNGYDPYPVTSGSGYKTLLTGDNGEIIDTIGTPELIIDKDGNITIKNIKVKKKENGNLTTISTDLVFDIGKPSVQIGSSVSRNTNSAEFAIITDQKVDISNANAISIVGSIYGGGKDKDKGTYTAPGLKDESNKTVDLYSDYIITRSSIETGKNAVLNIKSKVAGSYLAGTNNSLTNIWAKNILMNGKEKSTIDIEGNCYVEDDLTINGKDAKFKVSGNGSGYYGYSTTTDATKADESSSVVINAADVTVDFSKTSTLWLAGKSYVSVPDIWMETDGTGETYMQGESISIREMQSVYLLPGECIKEIGHNPMTEQEWITISTQKNVDGKTIRVINTDYIDRQGSNAAGIIVDSYLHPTTPCYASSVKYRQPSGDTNLVYLYMNFVDANMATEYMKNFEGYYDDLTKARVNMAFKKVPTDLDDLTTGAGIFLNPNAVYYNNSTKEWLIKSSSKNDAIKIVASGNILAAQYDKSDPSTEKYKYTLFKNSRSFYDADWFSQSQVLSGKFQFLYTSLSERSMGESIDKDLTDMLGIEFDNITAPVWKTINEPFTVSYYDTNGNTARTGYLIANNGDIVLNGNDVEYYAPGSSTLVKSETFSANGPAGIIISTGNVTLNNDNAFWGTVIAKGDVIVQGSGRRVIAATSSVRKAVQTDAVVKVYFGGEDSSGGGSGINNGSIVNINYNNWKKE